MTKDEVDALTKSFGLLQSRTARIDLLGIAKEGGKLGISKNEILDFVKVMDKATIALGEDFAGGAEEVANRLGKIKGLYGELRDAGVETSFEAVGSALNDLGADGAASEANIADFVTRIGSMPEVFKPSIAEALGLGAAFEESGINAEKAGSNYAKVITLAANNVAGFAKQMGKPKKAIEDLINTNPTEFFLQFSKSLKGLVVTGTPVFALA
jgi:tubulin-specific chaperone A